jgi:hypothetical protein
VGPEAKGETHVDEPGVDGTEHQVVLFVSIVDLFVMIYHPSELDGGEVGRQRETGAGV